MGTLILILGNLGGWAAKADKAKDSNIAAIKIIFFISVFIFSLIVDCLLFLFIAIDAQ